MLFRSRLLVGNTSAGSTLTKTIELSSAGTGTSQPAFQTYAFPGTTADNCGYLTLCRSRGATVGTNTIVSSGDRLGLVRFAGANGTGYDAAVDIYAEVDGAPGAANDMPGRLIFATTPDGSATAIERVRLNNTGYLLGNVNGLGQGIYPCEQYYRLNSDLVRSDISTAQSIFGVGVTLIASTIYEFEMVFMLYKTAGTNSHTIEIGRAHV